MPPTRLAIVSTHPVQYQAQWYRALAVHPDLEVHVFYCHQATPHEQAEAGFGVEFEWDVPLLSGYPYSFLRNVARRPGLGRFSGLDTPEIKDIIARREFDAVMVNGWSYKSAWQAIRTCWKSGVAVMVRSDSHLHTPRAPATKAAKAAFYPRFIPRFDACLAVGKWSREYFLRYGARPDRVFVVPHSVDNDFFRRQAESLAARRNDLRAKWGFGNDVTLFLFVGKFMPKKRPMDFVTGIRLAAQHSTEVKGLMVGDGPLREECRQLVQKHNVPVQFAGFLNQSEIATAYVAGDALVLPGGETWGLVVNEAMACRRPAFVSDHVGCGPDLIVPDETGFLFPLGNTQALANQMLKMASNPAQLMEMGKKAYKLIENYSVAVAADNVVQCLKSILK